MGKQKNVSERKHQFVKTNDIPRANPQLTKALFNHKTHSRWNMWLWSRKKIRYLNWVSSFPISFNLCDPEIWMIENGMKWSRSSSHIRYTPERKRFFEIVQHITLYHICFSENFTFSSRNDGAHVKLLCAILKNRVPLRRTVKIIVRHIWKKISQVQCSLFMIFGQK